MGYTYDINNILNARFGEVSNTLSADFKKTILIRNFETEVTDTHASLVLDHAIDGMDRVFISNILQAQLELGCYTSLYFQSRIPLDEYLERKQKIEYEINAMAEQYENLTGRSPGRYLDLVQNRG